MRFHAPVALAPIPVEEARLPRAAVNISFMGRARLCDSNWLPIATLDPRYNLSPLFSIEDECTKRELSTDHVGFLYPVLTDRDCAMGQFSRLVLTVRQSRHRIQSRYHNVHCV